MIEAPEYREMLWTTQGSRLGELRSKFGTADVRPFHLLFCLEQKSLARPRRGCWCRGLPEEERRCPLPVANRFCHPQKCTLRKPQGLNDSSCLPSNIGSSFPPAPPCPALHWASSKATPKCHMHTATHLSHTGSLRKDLGHGPAPACPSFLPTPRVQC
jgi:hypothetical protein